MSYTQEFTECHDVLAALAPITANGAVGAHVTGYVSLADYHRAFVFCHVGTPAGASTIDITVQQAQDTSGTGTKELTDITGVTGTKAPTQIVAADAGVYVGIEIRSAELDVSNGFHTVQITVTVGVAAYTYSLLVLGIVSRYEAVGITDFQEVIP